MVQFVRVREPSSILLTLNKAGMAWYLTKNALSSLQGTLADPDKEKHEQARIRAKANLSRLKKSRQNGERDGEFGDDSANGEGRGPAVEDLALNEYESMVALEVVAPEDISVGFDGKTHYYCAGMSIRQLTSMGRYWRFR